MKVVERELLDSGFRRVYQPEAGDAQPSAPLGQGKLARLKKGERVRPAWVSVRRQNQPKPAMTEAALIRAMQEHGIGRPSTYADTAATLIERGYAVRHEDGGLASTERGRLVLAFLLKRFPSLFDYGFTARVEARLDAIAQGQATYRQVVGEFWEWLQQALDEKQSPGRGI